MFHLAIPQPYVSFMVAHKRGFIRHQKEVTFANASLSTAKVQLEVAKFCDNGQIFSSKFTNRPLAMVVMKDGGNNIRPLTCNHSKSMDRFAKARQEEISGFAASFEELQEAYDAHFTWVTAQRAARERTLTKGTSGYYLEYSKEAIQDFIFWYDDFIKFVVNEDPLSREAYAGLPTIEVLLPHDMRIDLKRPNAAPEDTEIDESDASENETKGKTSLCVCEINVVYREVPRALLFSLPPPAMREAKHALLTIDIRTSSSLSLIFSNCWKVFSNELSSAGFVRKCLKVSSEETSKYNYHYFRDDLRFDDELITQFEDRVMVQILQNTPLKVEFRADPPLKKFVAPLRRKLSHLGRILL